MSVTAPDGWVAAGVHAGTKDDGRLDLAVILSDRPATVAGAFTSNRLQGAPIHVSRPRVVRGAARGVVVSAGIANVSTGPAGIEDAGRMAALAAEACGVPPDEMLVASTGKIGGRIPVDTITPGIRKACEALSPGGGDAAAHAILTTDTGPKQSMRTIDIGGKRVTVGGMCKGAGMIEPDLHVAHATMLAFVTTDGAATALTLRHAVESALPWSFNSVTVDGARSTSDTVLLFANGAAGTRVDGSPAFAGAVREVMRDLATMIAADGEGATRLVRVRVSGAASTDEAHHAARAVANSFILRSALWGGAPNWGRVLQAIGSDLRVRFDPSSAAVAIAGVLVATGGVETGRAADAALAMREPGDLTVEADLGLGAGEWEMLTCDISPDYPRLNAD